MCSNRRDFRPDKMIRKSHDGWISWDHRSQCWEEHKFSSESRGFSARRHNRRQREFNRFEIQRQLLDGEE